MQGGRGILLLLLLLLVMIMVVICDGRKPSGLGSDDEVRLVEYLFLHKGYNELIRPVANLSQKITVSLGLAMVQLIHVEEKKQIMKSNVWLRMQWYDYQLKWDMRYFGNIDVIRISPQRVWKPDIVLFNNADGKYEVSWQPNILVYHHASVIWIPPSIYKSSCTIDVTFFPFDQQHCDMKFGSWTFDATQVVLNWYGGKMNVDLSDYWKSGTWDVVACPGQIKNESKPGQPQQTQMVYTITLRRKTLFYTVNLLIPCVLISFLSICVFYLPADAGEKMTLCISILLALVVFLLLVSKILPPTSISIPLISKFLLFTFIMNIFTIMITVIIINWNFRSPRTHKMSAWVRWLFLHFLPMIFFMKRPDTVPDDAQEGRPRLVRCNGGLQRSPSPDPPPPPPPHPPPSFAEVQQQQQQQQQQLNLEMSELRPHHPKCRLSKRPRRILLADDDDAETTQLIARPNGRAAVGRDEAGDTWKRRSADSSQNFHGVTITPELKRAIEAINFISTHLQVEDEYSRVLQDWKYVASVIDRVQLVIFVTVTICVTIGLLLNAPYILEYVDQDEIIKKYSK